MPHSTHHSAAKTRSRRQPSRKTKSARARARAPEDASAAPRVTVGSALCHAGLDELALGKRWARVIRNLSKVKHRENLAVQKLLFDALKECTRQLDNDHEPQRSANVIVRLVHAVPRPPRAVAALPAAPPENVPVPAIDPPSQEPS